MDIEGPSRAVPESPDPQQPVVKAGPGLLQSHRRIWRGLLISVVLAVLVFAGMSFYADVQRVREGFLAFSWTLLPMALALSLVNYVVRALRFHWLLSRTGESVPLFDDVLVYFAGFPMSMTPGKVGELFRSLLLYDLHRVTVAKSAPVLPVEHFSDLTAMGVLILLGAPQGFYRIAGIFVTALGLSLQLLTALPFLGASIIAMLGRLGLGERWLERLRVAHQAAKEMVRPADILITTLFGVVAWGCQGFVLWWIVAGFGAEVSLVDCQFVYATSMVAGVIVMLPGGIGATEAGMAGLLVSHGLEHATAVGATLLTRVATLWWAVLVGLLSLAVLQTRFRRRERTPNGRSV